MNLSASDCPASLSPSPTPATSSSTTSSSAAAAVDRLLQRYQGRRLQLLQQGGREALEEALSRRLLLQLAGMEETFVSLPKKKKQQQQRKGVGEAGAGLQVLGKAAGQLRKQLRGELERRASVLAKALFIHSFFCRLKYYNQNNY